MAKEKLGDLAAYLGKDANGKGIYWRIGAAYRDTDYDSISIKIDTLPLPGANWQGWANIFTDTKSEFAAAPKDTKSAAAKRPAPLADDDIPF